jgi:hypothetical protein
MKPAFEPKLLLVSLRALFWMAKADRLIWPEIPAEVVNELVRHGLGNSLGESIAYH